MPAIRITGFAGLVPRRGERLLDRAQAQLATNCRLTSGYLAPLREPALVYDPDVNDVQSVFRMPSGGTDYWLAWDTDVDAVKGPVAGDTTYRTYYTGDFEPRATNISLALSAAPYPTTAYVLGVSPPTTACSVSHAGGSGSAVTRTFVYTFVTPWGEESAPSPASTAVAGKTDGTWTISGMATAMANTFSVIGATWSGGTATLTVASTLGLRVGEEIAVSGVNPAGYNTASAAITALTSTTIAYAVSGDPGAYVSSGTVTRGASHNTTGMTKRIYWSQTTSAGTFYYYYYYVGEVAVATTGTTVAGDITVGEELATSSWQMPPVTLSGLTAHSSGALVGFSGNTLYFSEPYAPYAWPAEYRLTADYDIVGIGVFGSTVVVCTSGSPYVATGLDPASIGALERVNEPWPCLAKRGVVSTGSGVLFPVPQGLAHIGMAGPELYTQDLYTQEEWTTLNPDTFRAALYSGMYVASYEVGSNARSLLILNRKEFASAVTSDLNATELWGDVSTGKLYLIIEDVIYEWDAAGELELIADWQSMDVTLPKPLNMAAAKVDTTFSMTAAEIAAAQAAYDAVAAANAAYVTGVNADGSLNTQSLNGASLNGSSIQPLPPIDWDYLVFRYYAGEELKFTKTLTSANAFRLPSGYKADTLSVRITSNLEVKAVLIGTTMQALEEA